MEKIKDKIKGFLIALFIVLFISLLIIGDWFFGKSTCELTGGKYIWGWKGDMCLYDKD